MCPHKDYPFVLPDVAELMQLPAPPLASALLSLQVAKVAPETRQEFEQWNSLWPTIFRPSAVAREREAGTHSEEDLALIGCYMQQALCDERAVRQMAADEDEVQGLDGVSACTYGKTDPTCYGGAVVANPETGLLVSRSADYYVQQCSLHGDHRMLQHPLTKQASLRCIHAVGAAVCLQRDQEATKAASYYGPTSSGRPSDAMTAAVAALSENQYLCSGLDVFCVHEPDLMTAMALVHSRIRRVYFLHAAPDGALASHLHVHQLRQLNHRYRVFQCQLS